MFQKTEVILFPNKERFATRSLLTGATLYKIPFWKWSESYSKPWQFFVLMQSSVPSRAVAFLWMHCCWRSQLSRCRTWHKHQCQLWHPLTRLMIISIYRIKFNLDLSPFFPQFTSRDLSVNMCCCLVAITEPRQTHVHTLHAIRYPIYLHVHSKVQQSTMNEVATSQYQTEWFELVNVIIAPDHFTKFIKLCTTRFQMEFVFWMHKTKCAPYFAKTK